MEEPLAIEPVSTGIPPESLSYIPAPVEFKDSTSLAILSSPSTSATITYNLDNFSFYAISAVTLSSELYEATSPASWDYSVTLQKNGVALMSENGRIEISAAPDTQPRVDISFPIDTPLIFSRGDNLEIVLKISNSIDWDSWNYTSAIYGMTQNY